MPNLFWPYFWHLKLIKTLSTYFNDKIKPKPSPDGTLSPNTILFSDGRYCLTQSVANSYFIKFLFGKESFYKVFSNDSYDRLKFHIFAWLGLNPDYAPDTRAYCSNVYTVSIGL